MSSSTEDDTGQKPEILSNFHLELDCLKQIVLFQNLEHECLKLIAIICKQVKFSPDENLMIQGEEGEKAFYIISGGITALHTIGGVEHIIRHYGHGDFIGGGLLLGKIQHNFTLRTREKTTALCLKRSEFLKVLELFPSSFAKVTGRLIRELVKWDNNMLTRQLSKQGDSGEPDDDSCTPGVSLI
jgi:CRP-like cAMP-binding protein